MKTSFPQLTHADVTLLQTENLYEGFFRMQKLHLQHRLFAGGWSNVFTREVLIRPKVAAVIPYDPILQQVVLIEQFRAGALRNAQGPWLIELVAGIATTTEPLEELAHREAQEEAGLVLQQLLPVCEYWASPGGSTEQVSIFCGIVSAQNAGGIHGLPDENEDILVHVIPTHEAFAWVRNGRINNAATIIALQWLELNLTRLRTCAK